MVIGDQQNINRGCDADSQVELKKRLPDSPSADAWNVDPYRTVAPVLRHYSGMLPCFFAGRVSRLFCSISSARMIVGRVAAGSITSSTYPRFAAT